MSRIYRDLKKKAAADVEFEPGATPEDEFGGSADLLRNAGDGGTHPSRPWIQTYGGRQFHFPPDPDEIGVEAISHSLSNVNRFTGHASTPYSVAEHSVRVSARAAEIAQGASPEHIKMVAKWGLIHDVSEAFTSDINSPLKRMPEMERFREVESQIMRVVCERYGLPPEMPEEVKRADAQVFFAEVEQLMNPIHAQWKEDFAEKWNPIPSTSVAAFRPWGFAWFQAKELFMQRWTILFGDAK